jgi:sulfite dehydrogenase (cytochrome) subunit B
MKKTFLIGLLLSLASAAHAAGPGFKSLHLDFPPDAASFPDGPNVKTVNQSCLACHSADMVLDQPLLPRATWAAEVAKMRNTYKAPLNDADIPLIVDYLAATHAPPE